SRWQREGRRFEPGWLHSLLDGTPAECRNLPALSEPPQRLRLDLPHALARDPELPPDLLERLRIPITVHPVAQLLDVALAFGQRLHCLPDSVLRETDVHLLRRLGTLAGDQVAEARVAFLTERPVQARDGASNRAHLLHVLDRQLRLARDFLVCRRPLELRCELALRARDLLLALDDVDGD